MIQTALYCIAEEYSQRKAELQLKKRTGSAAEFLPSAAQHFRPQIRIAAGADIRHASGPQPGRARVIRNLPRSGPQLGATLQYCGLGETRISPTSSLRLIPYQSNCCSQSPPDLVLALLELGRHNRHVLLFLVIGL